MAGNAELETMLLVDDCEDDVLFFKRSFGQAGVGLPVQEALDASGLLATLAARLK